MASDCFFCTNSFVPALLLYRCPDDAMLLWGWNTSEPRTQWGGYYPNPANSLLNKHWTTETSIECTCELGGKILYESLSNEQGLVLYVERAKISVFFVTIQFPVCFGGDIISIHDLDHEPHVELSDSFVVFPPLCLVFDVQMTFCFWGWNCPEASLSQIGRRPFQIQNVTDLRLVCVHITVHMTYVAFKLMNIYEDWIWISICRMERQRGGAKFRQTTTGAQLRRKREERGQVSFTPSWSWSWCSKELFPIKAPMLSGNQSRVK